MQSIPLRWGCKMMSVERRNSNVLIVVENFGHSCEVTVKLGNGRFGFNINVIYFRSLTCLFFGYLFSGLVFAL